MMYDELTIANLLVVACEKAHPENEPSAEHADLIDELITRLRRLDVWRARVTAAIDPYLIEEDGSDLVSEPDRIRYMLQRLSSAKAICARAALAKPHALPMPEIQQ